jgi:hypothetical protein
VYPYLKLEFFSKKHAVNGASAKKYIEPNTKTLGECGSIHASRAEINITPQMTVADLEQSLSNNYGLSVQVFRKSGKVWLETTFTDGWTLEEQNMQGEELSK